MKVRELNLPDCPACCGSGEQIDSSKIHSNTIDIPWKICCNCGGSGVDPKHDEDKPIVWFSNCCGAEANGNDLDYMICPSCKDHCTFEDENGVEREN